MSASADRRSAFLWLQRGGEWVAALLLAGVLVAILLGVVRRYLFGAPLVWIDELAVVLFLWCVFITGAFAVRLADHVAFELLDSTLPSAARRWVGVLGCGFAGLVLLAATPKIADFIVFLWRERTAALQWRLDFVYFCFVVFVVAVALRLLARAATLLRAGWQDRL